MTDTFKIQIQGSEKFDVIRMEGVKEYGRTTFLSMKSALKFVKACQLPDVEEEVCQRCGGEGRVTTMGYVYAGEPHMADVDDQPCHECR